MKHYHKNPRQITEKQFKQLGNWLEEYGDLSGIVHNIRTDELIGGNQRAEAMHFMNGTKPTITHKYKKPTKQGTVATGFFDYKGERFQYRQVSWTPKKAEGANIIANKAGGDWDFDVLANEFEITDLLDWGFTEKELQLGGFDMQTETQDAEPQIDRAEELLEVWKVKTGDLWQIGEHRLVCGDCTDAAVVERVMGGEKAELLMTDPPYGVDVVGDAGNIGGDTQYAKAGKYSPVIGDDKPFSPAHLFELAGTQIIWGANYFCLDLPTAGQWIVWDKNRPEGTTFSDCELAWTNSDGRAVKKYKCTWDGFHREGESGQRYHPTQKPLKLLQDVLEDFKGQLILDVYGGSGSTMVACNNLGRKCRMIEIDPKYCAVILQRMSDLGLSPVLVKEPTGKNVRANMARTAKSNKVSERVSVV